ncbi:hypothetical protein BH09PSE3_BH09PSE3_23400 [soil metagenome]
MDKTQRNCEPVEYYLKDMELKSVWPRPASLQLFDHVVADMSRLPVDAPPARTFGHDG